MKGGFNVKDSIVKANVLSTRLIPNVDHSLAKALHLKSSIKSLGLITADSDEVR